MPGVEVCITAVLLLTVTGFLCLLSTEVPPSPPPPDIVEVYEDGAQVVWKPVETTTPVHYTVQCKSEGKVERCP